MSKIGKNLAGLFSRVSTWIYFRDPTILNVFAKTRKFISRKFIRLK